MFGPMSWLTTMRLHGMLSLRSARIRRPLSFTPSTVGMVAMMNCRRQGHGNGWNHDDGTEEGNGGGIDGLRGKAMVATLVICGDW